MMHRLNIPWYMTGIILDALIMMVTVSYTHLDVYKRQALNSEQRTGGMNENIMSQDNFDMKA